MAYTWTSDGVRVQIIGDNYNAKWLIPPGTSDVDAFAQSIIDKLQQPEVIGEFFLTKVEPITDTDLTYIDTTSIVSTNLVKIDSIPIDSSSVTVTEVICHSGTTFNLECQVRDANGNIVPVNAIIKAALKAGDGREKIVIINLVNGIAHGTMLVNESGFWEINEELLNKYSDVYLNFPTGIKFFVGIST